MHDDRTYRDSILARLARQDGRGRSEKTYYIGHESFVYGINVIVLPR